MRRRRHPTDRASLSLRYDKRLRQGHPRSDLRCSRHEGRSFVGSLGPKRILCFRDRTWRHPSRRPDCLAYIRSMRKPSPQLLGLLADCSPGVAHVALALRDLVLMESPEAGEFLYSVYAEVIVFKLPGRKRGAFYYIAAYSRHVNLSLYHGAELPDLHGALKEQGSRCATSVLTPPTTYAIRICAAIYVLRWNSLEPLRQQIPPKETPARGFAAGGRQV